MPSCEVESSTTRLDSVDSTQLSTFEIDLFLNQTFKFPQDAFFSCIYSVFFCDETQRKIGFMNVLNYFALGK